MLKVIKSFIDKNTQEFHRYNSWEHCYEAFQKDHLDTDTLALHLGFYLASWGMYRGSSKLLQRDYKVHIEAVTIINTYKHLRCDLHNEVSQSDINDILQLVNELSNYYSLKHEVTPTDTLISKIILGTLGCLPAYDRFFINGVKSIELKSTTLKEKSLVELFKFKESNLDELIALKNKYPQFPIMKLIDMYFFQIGFERSKQK